MTRPLYDIKQLVKDLELHNGLIRFKNPLASKMAQELSGRLVIQFKQLAYREELRNVLTQKHTK